MPAEELWFDKIVPDSEPYQFAEAPESHFVHDVIAVTFDSARRDAERDGDLLVAFALRKKLHHF